MALLEGHSSGRVVVGVIELVPCVALLVEDLGIWVGWVRGVNGLVYLGGEKGASRLDELVCGVL